MQSPSAGEEASAANHDGLARLLQATTAGAAGLLIALVCAVCVLPAGSAAGAARSEVTVATSSDGDGVAFSGTVPSAKAGQRVMLKQRLKGRYRTIAQTTVRGKRRAFGDLDTGPLPVGTHRRYRLVGGDTLRMRWTVTCERTRRGGKRWTLETGPVRFVLPYVESDVESDAY